MHENDVSDYSDTVVNLANAIRELDTKIQVGMQNLKLKESYEEKIRDKTHNVQLCNGVIEKLKPMITDIEEYLDNRKTSAMQSINNALRIAGEIIPDAADGIKFELDGDDAMLVNNNGCSVAKTEGGGFHQVSSVFLREVILASNPDYLSTLFLDEIFSLVSEENSASLSLYLNVLTQNTQVISIEHKATVRSNIDHIQYVFMKMDTFAQVQRINVKRDATVVKIPSDDMTVRAT